MRIGLSKPVGIILLAFWGAVLTIVLLLFLVHPPASDTPARYLPSDHSTALLLNTNQVEREKFTALLPSLRSIGPVPAEADIAVLKIPCKRSTKVEPLCTKEVIALFTKGEASADPLTIRTIPPSAAPLLKREAPRRLSETRGFREIMRHVRGDRPLLYLKPQMLSKPETFVDTLIAPLLQETEEFALAETASGWLIAAFNPETPALKTLNEETRLAVSGTTLLSVTFSRPRKLVDSLQNDLSKNDVLIITAFLGKMSEGAFGKDVSFTYDILPLLEEETSLLLTQNGTGSNVRFLLQGGVTNREILKSTIEKLHQSKKNGMSSSVIIDRTFEQYRSRLIREDAESIQESAEQYRGWSLSSTLDTGSETGLVTAVRGREFLLGNTLEQVQEAIRNQRIASTRKSSISAEGSFRPENLRPLLPHTPWKPLLLSPLSTASKEIEWTLEQRGNVFLLKVIEN